jgi:hypothetical protein
MILVGTVEYADREVEPQIVLIWHWVDVLEEHQSKKWALSLQIRAASAMAEELPQLLRKEAPHAKIQKHSRGR